MTLTTYRSPIVDIYPINDSFQLFFNDIFIGGLLIATQEMTALIHDQKLLLEENVLNEKLKSKCYSSESR